MAIFENPNNPQQPKEGVYCWYAEKGDKRIAIYVGQAGGKRSSLPKGTLFRGVSELQRCTFSSNEERNALDTDFIVGTAIIFYERQHYDCFWKHISDDPKKELEFVLTEQPILQNTGNTWIKEEYKVRKQEPKYWRLHRTPDNYNRQKISEAEAEIFKVLSKYDL